MTDPSLIPFPVDRHFRMRPGLQRYDGPLTSRDAAFSAVQDCVTRAQTEAWLPLGEWGYPGLSEALAETVAVLGTSPMRTADNIDRTRAGVVTWPVNRPVNPPVNAPDSGADSLLNLRRQVQEDIVLLAPGEVGRVVALAVAMPSGWDPAEKLGLDFRQIHSVIPQADNILASAVPLIQMMTTGGPYRRHVWTLAADDSFSQHPQRRSAAIADGPVWFRVEQQTTVALPASGFCLFLIRVFQAPLEDVLAVQAGRAEQLVASLRSMTEPVIQYKSLTVLSRTVLRRYAH
ncbi:MAG: heme-dependent oxidative N-demethylase subunit alpha family protein [Burkholderiaceae bacterium]